MSSSHLDMPFASDWVVLLRLLSFLELYDVATLGKDDAAELSVRMSVMVDWLKYDTFRFWFFDVTRLMPTRLSFMSLVEWRSLRQAGFSEKTSQKVLGRNTRWTSNNVVDARRRTRVS